MALFDNIKRFLRTPASGANAGKQAVEDANLAVSDALNIPHSDDNTLNGAQVKDGYVKLSRNADGDLILNSYADGKWTEYLAVLDGLKSVGGITLDGNEVTIVAPVKWRINSVNYEKLTNTIITVESATDGFKRIDYIYADTTGNILLIEGTEVADGNPYIPPTLPVNTVMVAPVYISGDTVLQPIPDLSQYITRAEANLLYSIISPSGAYIQASPLNPQTANIDINGQGRFNNGIIVNSSARVSGNATFINDDGGHGIYVQGYNTSSKYQILNSDGFFNEGLFIVHGDATGTNTGGIRIKDNNLFDMNNKEFLKDNTSLPKLTGSDLFTVTDPKDYVQAGNVDASLGLYQLLSEKAQPNGYASLDGNSKIPNAQLPPLAITDVFPVNSQAAMLALTNAEQGDVAIRSDINKSFILSQNPASTLANWLELLTPTDTVQSVNGKVGVVSLGLQDAANVGNTITQDVAIGMNGTPLQTLHVNTNNASNNARGILISNSSFGGTGFQIRNSLVSSNQNWQFFIKDIFGINTNDFVIGQDNVADYITIRGGSGNIGIGKLPDEKLDVNGNIKSIGNLISSTLSGIGTRPVAAQADGTLVVGAATLEQVTDAGNFTNNAIQLQGADNADLDKDGMLLYNAAGVGVYLQNIKSSTIKGSISIGEAGGVTISGTDGGLYPLTIKSVSDAVSLVAEFAGRVKGVTGSNIDEFTTKGYVNDVLNKKQIIVVTANHTVLDTDYTIITSTAAANTITVTLPDPTTHEKYIYVFANYSGSNQRIETAGGALILLPSSSPSPSVGGSVVSGTRYTFHSDGNFWYAI